MTLRTAIALTILRLTFCLRCQGRLHAERFATDDGFATYLKCQCGHLVDAFPPEPTLDVTADMKGDDAHRATGRTGYSARKGKIRWGTCELCDRENVIIHSQGRCNRCVQRLARGVAIDSPDLRGKARFERR